MSHIDAIAGETLLDSAVGELWVVVVATEVAKPYVVQLLMEDICEEISRLAVAQVACSRGDPSFQVDRIATVHE